MSIQKVEIQFTDKTYPHTLTFDIPNKCDVCLATMSPLVISTSSPFSSEQISSIGLTLQCVECDHFFVKEFEYTPGYVNVDLLEIEKKKDTPHVYIPDSIRELSPTFVEIYNQALQSEINGLNHLVGMGIRKAIDYLVTEYCLSVATSDKEKTQIESKSLSALLKSYFTEMDRVQKVAEVATWIGNDETHYHTRHPQVGINELKKFASLLLRELDSELAYKDVIKFHDNAN